MNQRASRSKSNIKAATSTGVLEEKCIFCEKKHKKAPGGKGVHQKLQRCLTEAIQESIVKDAQDLNDLAFPGKIAGVDFVAKEVMYHPCCRVFYTNKANKKREEIEKARKKKIGT